MNWRRLVLAAAGAALALASIAGFASEEIPVPPLAARVTDLTGTLSAAQARSLDQSLREFESSKGSQIAVLMVPTVKPETIEQFSIRVAEAWKIGRARVDDGIIIVIAKNDQQLRIEVGRGLEGAIPDVIAKRVIREVIAPHFLANDFYGGIVEGSRALMNLIRGERLPAPAAPSGSAQSWDDVAPVLGVAFAVVMLLGTLLTKIAGRAAGSSLVALVAGGAAWIFTGGVFLAVIAAIISFILVMTAAGRHWGGGGTGWSGRDWSGGSGGFSGGGGGFGGGGASGSWGN
jgi:uncharacterized protein